MPLLDFEVDHHRRQLQNHISKYGSSDAEGKVYFQANAIRYCRCTMLVPKNHDLDVCQFFNDAALFDVSTI